MGNQREPTESEAGAVIVRFGKYQGKAIENIAVTPEGLLYLDWLRGQSWLKSDLKECLDVYLSTPHTSRELDVLLEEKD